MSKFLANENVPADVIEAIRNARYDVAWIREIAPGATDEFVLDISMSENRVLVTFDKDFGELAFRSGQRATCGVILLRPRLRSPDHLVRFVLATLSQYSEWEGRFSVARETRLRVVSLPE